MKSICLILFLYTISAHHLFSVELSNPILFVTQVPSYGFTSVTQTFSNHDPSITNAPRGGDLMILYPDGTVRNLTREAGYGESNELQGEKAIAVRQPCVHWSGKKALFSMVVGAPTKPWDVTVRYWQMYEVIGLGKGEKVTITKVPFQYDNYNYVSPIYGSDDNIIFTCDIPITRKRYHYPPTDEYESAKVVSGLWKLNVTTGEHTLLQHSPSGSFYPIVDSYGRIIFTRWDHLQRDQQADLDRQGYQYGTFNYESEDSLAQPLNSNKEIFPEPRTKNNPDYDPTYAEHTFNQFFPWEINQDGTGEETLNHVGRHEWGGTYNEGSFSADKNLHYIIRKNWVKNKYYLRGDSGPFQITEDPLNKGKFYAAISPEFAHETSGQLIRFSGVSGENPEDMMIEEITHSATASSVEKGKTPDPNHSGRYRNPLPLENGKLLAVHTFSVNPNSNTGTEQNPKVLYSFRMKDLIKQKIDGKEYLVSGNNITHGFVRTISYYNGNDYLVQRTDTLWELDPVEVRAREIPQLTQGHSLSIYESDIFSEVGVNPDEFRKWMTDKNLGLIVSRNVVTRDRNDDTQPYNLRVVGGVEHKANEGEIYDVEYMQIIQADLLRAQGGAGGYKTPRPGRRVLSNFLHSRNAVYNNVPVNDAPAGSVKIHKDGSIAAFVPAQRALSWQLVQKSGKPIVRERYWVTVQAGEIRVCASCHGVNKLDQLGLTEPINKPEALKELLQFWKENVAVGHVQNNEEEPNNVNIYPQPSQKSFTVSSYFPIIDLQIFDLMNNEVINLRSLGLPHGENNVPVNTEDLPSGVYFVQIKTHNGIVRKKVIIDN